MTPLLFLLIGFMVSVFGLVLAMGADQLDRLDDLCGYTRTPGRWTVPFICAGIAVVCMLASLLVGATG